MRKLLKVDNNGNIIELLPKDQSQGATDAGEIVALNTEGKIDPSMLPEEALGETIKCTAGEALSKGDLVYLYNDDGTVKCRKAKANDIDTIADGFVKKDYNDGDTEVSVYFEGELVRDDMTFTVGAAYFLSNSNAGQVTDTAPSGVGVVIQRIGAAIGEHTIQFERQQPIIRPVSEANGGGANNPVANTIDGGGADDSSQDNFIDGGTAEG